MARRREPPEPPEPPELEEDPQTDAPDLGDDLAISDLLDAAVQGQADDADPVDDPSAPVTDPDSPAPNTGAAPFYSLSADDLSDLGSEIFPLLDEHDLAIEDRRQRLDRCLASYRMVHDPARGGLHPHSAELTSEMTKSTCDQAKARLSAMILNTKPLIKVDASDATQDPESAEIAESAEVFLASYAESELNIDRLLPDEIDLAVKTGDGISYDIWEEGEDEVVYYNDDGELVTETRLTAGITCRQIHYRDFYLWPLAISDWQEEYQLVGHDGPKLTRADYTRRLSAWGLPADEIETLTSSGHEPDHEVERQERESGVDTAAVSQDTFRITEIWYHGAIGPLDWGKHQLFLDRDRRQVLRAGPNPLHCRLHPYQRLPYKRSSSFAFSEGVAEELLQAQAIDTTIDNMEVDNWSIVGLHAGFYDENAAPEGFMTELYPGKWQGVAGDPNKAVMIQPLGGPIEALAEAKEQNNFRAMRATGLPPVLTGMGDPIMKSGADVTSLMALISEAGRKFGDIDQGIKKALSDRVEYWLELFAQYAPEGLFRKHLSPRRATDLSILKYVPPRGRIKGRFRIQVQAPSPSSNRELQKQHIMILNSMADNYLVLVERLAMEVYGAEGRTQSVLDFKRSILEYKTRLWQKITELHEVPGLIPFQPQLEDPTPEDQMIDQLRAKLQQMGTQLQQMMVENQVHQRAAQIMEQQPGIGSQQAQQMAQAEIQQAMMVQQQAAGGNGQGEGAPIQ